MKSCDNLRITEKEKREWLGKPYPDNYTESESQFKFTNWQQNIPELLWEIFNGSPMDIEMLRQQIKKDLSNNQNIEAIDLNKINKEEIKDLGASRRLLRHAQHTNSQVYITGINSTDYLDVEIFKKNNIYHLVQKFNYDIFRNLQKCEDPLSIIHQIAHLGFDNLANLMNETQINKEKILTDLK